jgi:type VI secretion system secreted protein VgrG
MPSPGSGSANSITAPTAPTAAQDADDADPGVVEAIKAVDRATQTGKYGSVQSDAFKPQDPDTQPASQDPAQQEQQQEPSWIEIKLVDEDNRPVVGESYQITLPNNQVAGGMTDANGVGRVEGFDPGQCQVTFPELDKTVWQDK